MTDHEKGLGKKLTQEFQKLDSVQKKAPELSKFIELIKSERKRRQKIQNIQFGLFVILSVLVAAAVILCIFFSAALFISIQISMFAAGCLTAFHGWKRRAGN